MSAIKTSKVVRICHNIRSTSNSCITITFPQRIAGSVDGGKAGRASCVDAKARSAELKVIIDAAGREGSVSTRNEISIDILTTVDFSPVVTRHTIEDTNPVALAGRSRVRDKP